VGGVLQSQPQHNDVHQVHWDRLERADLFAQYRELRTQGRSERQAATEIKGALYRVFGAGQLSAGYRDTTFRCCFKSFKSFTRL